MPTKEQAFDFASQTAQYLAEQLLQVSFENVLIGVLFALIVACFRGIFGGGCKHDQRE